MIPITVLITKQNKPLFQSWGVYSFTDESANTCSFSVPESKLCELIDLVKAIGGNPFALMTW